MNNNLGKTLKERRLSKEMTLRQLSSKSGVSVSHLGRTERGERFPSARILRKLAKPLGFAETELLKLAGFMSQDDSDRRIKKLKLEIKAEIIYLAGALYRKVDEL